MVNETIKEFKGDYRFLSNFHDAPIKMRTDNLWLTWKTVEHHYQAMKSLDLAYRQKVYDAIGPGQAKRFGRDCPTLRHDWKQIRVPIMRGAVLEKFLQNEELGVKLLETGNAILQEGNMWGDTFWGVSLVSGKGENELGTALMDARGWIREYGDEERRLRRERGRQDTAN